jgi:acetyl esterase/lipase
MIRAAATICLLLGISTLAGILLSDLIIGRESIDVGWRQLLASVPAITLVGIGLLFARNRSTPLGGWAISVVLLGGALLGLSSILLVLASIERGRGFRYDRTTGHERILALAARVGASNLGVCWCVPDAEERIRLPGGFETRVTVFGDDPGQARPGIVISHGNTWHGGSLSTYRLLARRLAAKGHVVITVDYPGFGQADSPFGRGPENLAHAYDRPSTLQAAIEYLVTNTNVDRSSITLFGHSGGVDWAMRTAVESMHVARVAVMVAPPSAAPEGSLTVDTPEYEVDRSRYYTRRMYEQHKYVYGTKVPDWYDWELAFPDGRYGDDIYERFVSGAHPPLLLILGELDQHSGHGSVMARFDALSEPKEMILLRHADHYLNTAQSLGFVFYDARVADQLTEALADWIRAEDG